MQAKQQMQQIRNIPGAQNPNAPEKKFSTGAVIATVWKNAGTSKDGQPIEYRSVSLDRRYLDKDGLWKSTTSLRQNDLPKAALVLTKAYEFMTLKNDEALE